MSDPETAVESTLFQKQIWPRNNDQYSWVGLLEPQDFIMYVCKISQHLLSSIDKGETKVYFFQFEQIVTATYNMGLGLGFGQIRDKGVRFGG